MKKILLDSPYNHIYFSGIGGISMSGLAQLLIKDGIRVSGSDIAPNKNTEILEGKNVKINFSQVSENITDDIDLLVYTSAIAPNNPELLEVKKRNIKTMDRASLLGQIMENFNFPICISGTHGKSTTTAMVAEIFLNAKKNPTISLGANLSSINGNFKIGDEDYFIVESCEYFDSFLQFKPFSAAILNLELDHVDYFKDLDHLRSSFHKFSENVDSNGFLVINNQIENYTDITNNLDCKIVTFGDETADFHAKNITFNNIGLGSFDLYINQVFEKRISLNVIGTHNISNALAAIATAINHGIDKNIVFSAIENYRGIERRFQYIGDFNNIKIIDDYAHHPTEIKCTLDGTTSMDKNELWCVFQPHTFSRTLDFLEDFSNSFDSADNIVITDIYSAREPFTDEIHSLDIVKKLKEKNKTAYYFETFEQCEDFLINNAKYNDIILTMGAGDVHKIGTNILRTVKSNQK